MDIYALDLKGENCEVKSYKSNKLNTNDKKPNDYFDLIKNSTIPKYSNNHTIYDLKDTELFHHIQDGHLGNVFSFSTLPNGLMALADNYNNTIYTIEAFTGKISKIVEMFSPGYTSVALDKLHNIYYANDGYIYKLNTKKQQVKEIIAGNGIIDVNGFKVDNVNALKHSISNMILSMFYDEETKVLYFYDNFQVKRLDPNGLISTVAGNGYLEDGISGSGALDIGMGYVYGMTDIDGVLFLTDNTYRVLRKIADGVMTVLYRIGDSNYKSKIDNINYKDYMENVDSYVDNDVDESGEGSSTKGKVDKMLNKLEIRGFDKIWSGSNNILYITDSLTSMIYKYDTKEELLSLYGSTFASDSIYNKNLFGNYNYTQFDSSISSLNNINNNNEMNTTNSKISKLDNGPNGFYYNSSKTLYDNFNEETKFFDIINKDFFYKPQKNPNAEYTIDQYMINLMFTTSVEEVLGAIEQRSNGTIPFQYFTMIKTYSDYISEFLLFGREYIINLNNRMLNCEYFEPGLNGTLFCNNGKYFFKYNIYTKQKEIVLLKSNNFDSYLKYSNVITNNTIFDKEHFNDFFQFYIHPNCTYYDYKIYLNNYYEERNSLFELTKHGIYPLFNFNLPSLYNMIFIESIVIIQLYGNDYAYEIIAYDYDSNSIIIFNSENLVNNLKNKFYNYYNFNFYYNYYSINLNIDYDKMNNKLFLYSYVQKKNEIGKYLSYYPLDLVKFENKTIYYNDDNKPTLYPTFSPSQFPTKKPTFTPSFKPTNLPTITPTYSPTIKTSSPTSSPTSTPTLLPTKSNNENIEFIYKLKSTTISDLPHTSYLQNKDKWDEVFITSYLQLTNLTRESINFFEVTSTSSSTSTSKLRFALNDKSKVVIISESRNLATIQAVEQTINSPNYSSSLSSQISSIATTQGLPSDEIALASVTSVTVDEIDIEKTSTNSNSKGSNTSIIIGVVVGGTGFIIISFLIYSYLKLQPAKIEA